MVSTTFTYDPKFCKPGYLGMHLEELSQLVQNIVYHVTPGQQALVVASFKAFQESLRSERLDGLKVDEGLDPTLGDWMGRIIDLSCGVDPPLPLYLYDGEGKPYKDVPNQEVAIMLEILRQFAIERVQAALDTLADHDKLRDEQKTFQAYKNEQVVVQQQAFEHNKKQVRKALIKQLIKEAQRDEAKTALGYLLEKGSGVITGCPSWIDIVFYELDSEKYQEMLGEIDFFKIFIKEAPWAIKRILKAASPDFQEAIIKDTEFLKGLIQTHPRFIDVIFQQMSASVRETLSGDMRFFQELFDQHPDLKHHKVLKHASPAVRDALMSTLLNRLVEGCILS